MVKTNGHHPVTLWEAPDWFAQRLPSAIGLIISSTWPTSWLSSYIATSVATHSDFALWKYLGMAEKFTQRVVESLPGNLNFHLPHPAHPPPLFRPFRWLWWSAFPAWLHSLRRRGINSAVLRW